MASASAWSLSAAPPLSLSAHCNAEVLPIISRIAPSASVSLTASSKSRRRTVAPPRSLAESATAEADAEAEAEAESADAALSSSESAEAAIAEGASSVFQVDSVVEKDLKSNGFRSTRRTKLICTVGPACSSAEELEALAIGGMNVARLNMCHGTQAWHREVISRVRRLNEEKGYSVAVMMDTEGSEIHMGDFGTGDTARKADDGAEWVFTVRQYPPGELPPTTIQVNYDGFVDDVQEGDEISVDGGMARFQVLAKIGPDVMCRVTDPGLLLPRANITFFRNGQLIRARNAMLPTISSKDWLDIDFGIKEGVDYIAISFVKSPDVLTQLRSYILARSPSRYIGLIAKIESSDSLHRLHEIVAVSDGAMVARGDLGAQIPLELVPAVQQQVVSKCRELNKPVIVASQLLESMIEFPTPTRAEVADVSEAVRQRADALMLSGESAVGLYPQKALSVLRTVSTRIEAWCRQDTDPNLKPTSAASSPSPSSSSASSGVIAGYSTQGSASQQQQQKLYLQQLPHLSNQLNDLISEELCHAAANMARKLHVDAIFVYTRRGYMASLLSRCRPDCPIFAFTSSQDVRQRLNMYWGLIPFFLDFSEEDMEANLQRTFRLLKARGMLKKGDLIISVTAPAGGVTPEGVGGSLYQNGKLPQRQTGDIHLDSRTPSGDLTAGSGKPSIQIRRVP